MSLKSRNCTLKVRENTYEVLFPTNRQLIAIEVLKEHLSDGTYGSLIKSGTVNAYTALNYIDMIAYFRVLVPGLESDCKTKNLETLDPIDSKELLHVYKMQFVPWYNEWSQLLNTFEPEEKPSNAVDENEVHDELSK